MPIIYGQVGGFKHYAEQPEYVPRKKAKRAQAENANNKPWDDWELRSLMDPSKTLGDIASETGRTEGACRRKAWALNISFAGRE